MEPTVKFAPGVVRGATPADTPGTWYETNLIRWVGGVLRPIPAWDRISTDTALASNVRAIHHWIDNDNIERIGVLCDNNIYVYNDGAFVDVSPVDFVGPSGSLLAGGYGTFDYSDGTYGTPRPPIESIKIIGPAWSIDNWGETLVVMSSYDGRLLQWNPVTPTTKAARVTGSPIGRQFVVTPERHVAMFGVGGDHRTWGWCSQEDIQDWNFASVTNTAGSYDIEPSAPIIAAKVSRAGITFFTSKRAYFARYVGVPYVYQYEEIGEDIAPVSPHAVTSFGDKSVWWSENGFWTYDSGSLVPLACPILDWLSETSDPVYRRLRPFAFSIGRVNEVWWFFPDTDSSDGECNRYVAWNFVTQEWSMGLLKRSAGFPGSHNTYPIMGDSGYLYYHEKGWFYGDNPLPYAESGAFNVRSGTRMLTVTQMVASHANEPSSVFYTIFARMGRVIPNSPGERNTGKLRCRADGYVDARITGRDLRVRIETAADGMGNWSFGELILQAAQRGKR